MDQMKTAEVRLFEAEGMITKQSRAFDNQDYAETGGLHMFGAAYQSVRNSGRQEDKDDLMSAASGEKGSYKAKSPRPDIGGRRSSSQMRESAGASQQRGEELRTVYQVKADAKNKGRGRDYQKSADLQDLKFSTMSNDENGQNQHASALQETYMNPDFKIIHQKL